MRYAPLFSIALVLSALSLEAQLPIRNYVNLHKDSILVLLEAEGMEYDVYSDQNEYWDDNFYDEAPEEEENSVKEEELAISPLLEESTISVYSSLEFGYTGNEAQVFLRGDVCYLVQYNWFGDNKRVLASIREVLNSREDFSPCSDMPDCWTQQRPGEETVFYWNLYDQYESDANWQALRIEAEK